MSRNLEVFVCGREAGEASNESSTDSIAFRPTESAMVGSALNRLAEQSTADFVAFTDRGQVSEPYCFEKALAALESHSDAVAAMVPFDSSAWFLESWRKFPARLATLIDPPERHAYLIFRRSTLEQRGNFRDVSEPIWDWLMRAACGGHSVDFVETATSRINDRTDHDELPDLVPRQPGRDRDWLREHLTGVQPPELLPRVGSKPDAVALKAGLLQRHDYLDESHKLSQSMEGQGVHQAGDYWHAIMHRRESDYWNSKYWFRRVGRHPIYKTLAHRAAAILEQCNSSASAEWQDRLHVPDDWDPFAYVDLCETCARSGDESLVHVARGIQLEEMMLLLAATYDDASA